MQPSTQNTEAFKSLLKLQIARMSSYRQHLERLRQATERSNHHLVEELVERNAEMVRELESAHQELLDLLPALGCAAAGEGLNKCLEQFNDEATGALKDEFEQQSTALKKAIMVNDQAIRTSQQRVRQAIRILTGRIHEASTETYSARGEHSTSPGNQRIIARV